MWHFEEDSYDAGGWLWTNNELWLALLFTQSKKTCTYFGLHETSLPDTKIILDYNFIAPSSNSNFIAPFYNAHGWWCGQPSPASQKKVTQAASKTFFTLFKLNITFSNVTFTIIAVSILTEIIHSFIALQNHCIMFPALYSDL